MELHGGTIDVKSQEGQERVSRGASGDETQTLSVCRRGSMGKTTILVVEDDLHLMEGIRDICRSAGMMC